MKKIILLLLLSFPVATFSQEKKIVTTEIAVNSLINGTLFIPEKTDSKTKLVILIAGSGPTDRNGNQEQNMNNSLKFLAEALAKNDIAVFSYDKRILTQIKSNTLDEKTLRFDDFITDAKDVLTYFKMQKKYAKIIIAGHSEGSLIGMVAARDADAYVSISGAGRGIDEVVTEQIIKQAPPMKAEIEGYFAKLKNGETFELKNEMLGIIFRESVQPYMISWLKYNPQQEIAKLKIPTLIINGTKDMQVSVGEAELLKAAKPDAKLEIITNMNHIFKEINGDEAENIASYSKPEIPIITQLPTIVTRFVESL
jgi:pimeloyl-ACP methyl ester carboxylesterase